MAEDVEIKLYLDHVKITIENATEETLKKLAYRVVEGAQMQIRENDQIDTGFMVNSIYPVWKDGSGYEAAKSEAESKITTGKDRRPKSRPKGAIVDQRDRMAPKEDLPNDAAAGVVVGANYAIYQELAKPFLYPAAERAAREFGGEAEKIYKEILPEEGPKS